MADTHPGDAERLHEYWVHGEGAAKIRWGEPGDFDRCVMHLGKYIADPKGYCNLAHHAALGIYPATHAKLINAGRNAGMAHEIRAKYSADQMKSMAAKGQAMKNATGEPSYPIADAEDLSNAIHAVGRGGSSHDAIRRHIISRAKALGLSSRIPDNWNPDGSMSDSDSNGSGGRSARRPVERRFTKAAVGLVLTGGEESRDGTRPARIGGYAAKFNIYSRDLGHFVEQIGPTIFNKSRGDGWPDVICRFNHDDSQLLGTIAGRTLELGMDRDGLLYDVEPPPSMRHVIDWVQRGDVSKSSFAFRSVEDEWGLTPDGGPLRTVHSAQLVDVAPVVTPAYADTTAGLRSLAEHFDADFEEVRSLADAHELRRFFVRTDVDGGARPRPAMYPAVAMAQLEARRRGPVQ